MELASYGDYVNKVRDWSDKHLEGGADSLPGYLQNENEIKQRVC